MGNLLGHLWPQDKILDTYFPLWSILYIWEILGRQESRKSLDNWSSALGVREAPYLTSPPTKDLWGHWTTLNDYDDQGMKAKNIR